MCSRARSSSCLGTPCCCLMQGLTRHRLFVPGMQGENAWVFVHEDDIAGACTTVCVCKCGEGGASLSAGC